MPFIFLLLEADFSLPFHLRYVAQPSSLLLSLNFMKKWLNNIFFFTFTRLDRPWHKQRPFDSSQKTPLAVTAPSPHFSQGYTWTRTSLKPPASLLFHPRKVWPRKNLHCILLSTCDEISILNCERTVTSDAPHLYLINISAMPHLCPSPSPFLLFIWMQRSH